MSKQHRTSYLIKVEYSGLIYFCQRKQKLLLVSSRFSMNYMIVLSSQYTISSSNSGRFWVPNSVIKWFFCAFEFPQSNIRPTIDFITYLTEWVHLRKVNEKHRLKYCHVHSVIWYWNHISFKYKRNVKVSAYVSNNFRMLLILLVSGNG